ncbi:MAG: RnfABCDGE type electron transport complex subunit G [Eubacterium sp.]|nr:RnfABCDGE type electron transport complex subunit G [Eubacterium sp.]
MKSSLIKDALILTAITLVAGLLLGLVYGVTKEPIAAAEYQAQQEAYAAVFSSASSFEEYADFDASAAASALEEAGLADQNTIESVMLAQDDSGETLGYVITVTDSAGYGGDVTFSVGIANDGTLGGIAFTTLNETAGLGQKAKEEAFSSQFVDRITQALTVVKTETESDDEIQAISGATITSSAVTSGVNACLTYFYNVLGGGAS